MEATRVRRSTIMFVEIGMIGGIIVAGYTLPDDTPLTTFLIVSGVCFVLGNLFLIRKVRQKNSQSSDSSNGRVWIHILRALAILAIAWLLVRFLFKH
jgi:hypothetical protein